MSPPAASPPASTSTTKAVPALVVEGLTKAYGATQALDDVSFSLGQGEILALLGGNGSGKSTAIKVLAGVVGGDAGTLQVGETAVAVSQLNPALSRSLGLRFVHQQPAIFPMLSIAENIALGYEFPRELRGPIRWRQVRSRAESALDRFGLDLDVTQPASSVRPATQALIAIVRALQDLDQLDRAVLVLDEPTAALPHEEASTLLRSIERYAAQGLGVILVTHRLEEVLEVATAATVLKDGKVAARLEQSGITHESLVEGIVGATIERPEALRKRAVTDGTAHRLKVSGLSGNRLDDVSFEVGQGEIVGIAGLLGSGRSTLLRTLFGCTPYSAGEVLLDGEPTQFRRPSDAIEAGLAYVPEDRSKDSIFHSMSVVENLSMVTTGEYWRAGMLRLGRERRDARSLMKRFGIKAPAPSATIDTLSGGNQQKVVMARWIRRPLRLLLLDEPAQGVDVGARSELFAAITEAAVEGTSVLMVSSDFEELSLICSRVLVIRRGRIVEEIVDSTSDATALEHAVHRTEI